MPYLSGPKICQIAKQFGMHLTYNDGIYSLNKLIHKNSFELQISIKDKKINAKLIDLDFILGSKLNLSHFDKKGALAGFNLFNILFIISYSI